MLSTFPRFISGSGRDISGSRGVEWWNALPQRASAPWAPGGTCLRVYCAWLSGKNTPSSLFFTCPKVAVSAARIKSQAIANSHPPPSAKPLTAAMIGVRTCRGSSRAGRDGLCFRDAGRGLWGGRLRVRQAVSGGGEGGRVGGGGEGGRVGGGGEGGRVRLPALCPECRALQIACV